MRAAFPKIIWWVGVNPSDKFFRVCHIELAQYILLEKDGFEFRIFAPNFELLKKEEEIKNL